jgi:hypothetical protein
MLVSQFGIPFRHKTGVKRHTGLGLGERRLQNHAMTGTAIANKVDLLPIQGGMTQAGFFGLFQNLQRLLLIDFATQLSIDDKLEKLRIGETIKEIEPGNGESDKQGVGDAVEFEMSKIIRSVK